MSLTTISPTDELELHRRELTGYCYRMLGSPFEAQDAVQETMLRAWRGIDRLQGRGAMRAWLYRIATNVCFDMLAAGKRRALPMDLGPSREPGEVNIAALPGEAWIEPVPTAAVAADDPADAVVARETVRLAFIAALQHLPARQRAALILCEVLNWKAAEAAELLETSVPAINSALQRARATVAAADSGELPALEPLGEADRALLDRYVAAFEAYDIGALTSVIHEDATQSMPPIALWLSGREDIFDWWFGPGALCSGSRLLAAGTANGCPAFAQYKPSESGSGFDPWALQVLELRAGRVARLTFFLDTASVFPLFGMPARLEA